MTREEWRARQTARRLQKSLLYRHRMGQCRRCSICARKRATMKRLLRSPIRSVQPDEFTVETLPKPGPGPFGPGAIAGPNGRGIARRRKDAS